MWYPTKSRHPHALRRLLTATVVTTACAVAIGAAPSGAAANLGAQPTGRADTVLQWWDVAGTTLVGPAAPQGIEHYRAWAIVWFAGARAVNQHPAAGPDWQFQEAAFAAAVHESLMAFVPTRGGELDQALATTLSRIPDGRAETAGLAAGRTTARDLLADRQADGLDNVSVSRPITLPAPAPGIWRPTPPGMVAPLWPSLPAARPFVLDRGDQFRPGPPPAPGTDRYRTDFAEVRDVGSAGSTVRTARQTDIATFIYTAPPTIHHPAIRAALQEMSGNLKQEAEFLAVVRLALMDTGIAVWDAKYAYVNWRPITAIREADTDGDPATSPDPTWTPLHVTPPHPDYLSGHAGLMGAVTQALKAYTGSGPGRQFTLTNPNSPGITLTYRTWDEMNQDTIDARVWSGIHTRTADVVAARVGGQITRHIILNSRRLFD